MKTKAFSEQDADRFLPGKKYKYTSATAGD